MKHLRKLSLKHALVYMLAPLFGAALCIGTALSFSKTVRAAADDIPVLPDSHEHTNVYTGGNMSEGTYYLGDKVENASVTVTGNVTLCLNGFDIEGNEESSVITVSEGATLTLCDCQGTGHITNGYELTGGGGVCVKSDGKLIMTGGTISGNEASYSGEGGGVYVAENAEFEMSGGAISGNHGFNGGGVYVKAGGAFTMTGGDISGNEAPFGGGVEVNGTFTMSGGTISGNRVNGFYGAALEVNGTFNVYGAPTITDNKGRNGGKDIDNNVYLRDGKIINVTDELTDAQIGIYSTGEVATGFTQDNPSEYFIPDNPANDCIYVSEGTVNIGTHVWNDGTVTTQPTCTQEGEKTFMCSLCGETKTESVEVLGHNYGEWTVTKEATETEEGEERRICANDETHYETRAIPK